MAKHALVLSGGGARGAFEAGAAAEIIDWYSHTDSPITILSGTSVGALNAAGIAHGGPWYPVSMWDQIDTASVYKSSALLVPWYFWRKGSIYDSSPLKNLIHSKLDEEAILNSEFQLAIHATDLISCRQITFTNTDPDILTGVYASASVPGAFQPVIWKGMELVDGALVSNTPIRSAIRVGAEKITVIMLDEDAPEDPILAMSLSSIQWSKVQPRGVWDTVRASLEAMMAAHFQRDLALVETINKLVASDADSGLYRHIDLKVMAPHVHLGEALDFDNGRVKGLIDQGVTRAKEWLRTNRNS